MPYVSPKEIRSKLTTAFGKQVFDRLNSMNPNWVCVDQTENVGQVLLSPEIAVKAVGDNFVFSLGDEWNETLDDAVISVFDDIQRASLRNSGMVVVNTGDGYDYRKEYTFDKRSCTFAPC